MRSTVKRTALAVLVGCVLVALWGSGTDRDVVVAQRQTGIVVTRMFTGPDGQTHAEEKIVNLKANGTLGALRSDTIKVTGVEFGRNPVKYVNDWHNAPRRQYVVTLSGHEEIEMGGGKKIQQGPGQILLAEDLTGKGHISRVVGSEDRVALFIPIADK
jgi:quercetin dioxygenase-like cupin family protein